ncbi:hypothetical protein SAMN04488514_1277 [Kriegella aquimaris]|uniref:Uncharacterized protein n=1 Tax=Kriegella aquimaris TaxID=192904 RepID=A0A1G9YWF9_9FLAO|nr:hypothetical protein SAMN04488514_1277 [Kriegella aquimaris]
MAFLYIYSLGKTEEIAYKNPLRLVYETVTNKLEKRIVLNGTKRSKKRTKGNGQN